MSAASIPSPIVSKRGEPVWAIAEFYPQQGTWSEEAYLAIPTKRIVEYDNGSIEILPMPTRVHQLMVALFYELLKSFLAGKGRVIFAAYPLKIPTGKYREPDVLYMTPEQDARARNKYTDAAELVMEVVSEDDPKRDYIDKREDYAAAGVPEYWIVDRFKNQIIVLALVNGSYVEHGVFARGQSATSRLLPGFVISVDVMMSQE